MPGRVGLRGKGEGEKDLRFTIPNSKVVSGNNLFTGVICQFKINSFPLADILGISESDSDLVESVAGGGEYLRDRSFGCEGDFLRFSDKHGI